MVNGQRITCLAGFFSQDMAIPNFAVPRFGRDFSKTGY
jgi:hypothetical protein